MDNDTQFYDFAEFLNSQSPSRTSLSSQGTGLSFWDPTSTPATSPPMSERFLLNTSTSNVPKQMDLASSVTLSFTKGEKLFKIKYSRVEVCRDSTGSLSRVELSDPGSMSGPFIHTFVSAKRPIPHLEQPATSSEKSLRVCFLEEQMVQVAQTVFNAQPRYTFENSNDCDNFQEAVLGFPVLFVAGVAEIISKGRGEEVISQNLRICKYSNGSLNILFFANSQRKEKKRYVVIPIDTIDSFEPPKKPGKPVNLKLTAGTDLAAQMKAISIVFLDNSDARRLCTFLQGCGIKPK